MHGVLSRILSLGEKVMVGGGPGYRLQSGLGACPPENV